jgi:hypothetical protein
MSSQDWEFRLAEGTGVFAFYDPGNGPWFLPESSMRGQFINSGDIDGLGFDWVRFLPAQRASAEVLKVVASWREDHAGNEAVQDLAARLERAGYRVPQEGHEDEG